VLKQAEPPAAGGQQPSETQTPSPGPANDQPAPAAGEPKDSDPTGKPLLDPADIPLESPAPSDNTDRPAAKSA
jgi:hypothetical protein